MINWCESSNRIVLLVFGIDSLFWYWEIFWQESAWVIQMTSATYTWTNSIVKVPTAVCVIGLGHFYILMVHIHAYPE